MTDLRAIHQFIDILPDPILFLDDDFKVCHWNQAAEYLFLVKHEPLPIPLQDLLQIDNMNDLCQMGTNIEASILGSVPKRVALSMSVYQQQKLLCLRDITHLHQLEKMRVDFVANVSHELRTPLTVVQGYLETLLVDEFVGNDVKDILRKVSQQSDRMHRLVDDLLLLATIESEEMDEGSVCVDVPIILSELLDEAKILSGQQQHQFQHDIDADLKLYGHEKEIQGAFANLVVNAVNYTPQGEQIHLSWKLKDTGAYFTVTDTGHGFASHHIPRLTERFYRVDKGRSRESGGTGLGLAIVKHVLLRHDAELIIKSEVGKGSSFTCHFPLHRCVQ